jgi:enoyl-CoA hydratase
MSDVEASALSAGRRSGVVRRDNRLVPEGKALEGALELAARVASAGPLAVAATKRIARSSADWTLAEGWEEQERIIAPVFVSEDAREGAAAFAEKRGPVWSGR